MSFRRLSEAKKEEPAVPAPPRPKTHLAFPPQPVVKRIDYEGVYPGRGFGRWGHASSGPPCLSRSSEESRIHSPPATAREGCDFSRTDHAPPRSAASAAGGHASSGPPCLSRSSEESRIHTPPAQPGRVRLPVAPITLLPGARLQPLRATHPADRPTLRGLRKNHEFTYHQHNQEGCDFSRTDHAPTRSAALAAGGHASSGPPHPSRSSEESRIHLPPAQPGRVRLPVAPITLLPGARLQPLGATHPAGRPAFRGLRKNHEFTYHQHNREGCDFQSHRSRSYPERGFSR